LTEAYRSQLIALDQILAGCGHINSAVRVSLFNIPSSLEQGKGDHPIELHGPLSVASALAENLLLEYAEGMSGQDLAWNCIDASSVRSVMQLHSAAAEITQRTPTVARIYASNLLNQILMAIEQSAASKSVSGAPGRPGDRLLFLVGHDTNIATLAGSLGLSWIIDGRRDDTPPGGALVFELWHSDRGTYSVRVHYTAQTLDQMRESAVLSLGSPPERVPVFVPGCSDRYQSCSLQDFSFAVRHAIELVPNSRSPN
jgi:4-phytase/acid phosphatase